VRLLGLGVLIARACRSVPGDGCGAGGRRGGEAQLVGIPLRFEGAQSSFRIRESPEVHPVVAHTIVGSLHGRGVDTVLVFRAGVDHAAAGGGQGDLELHCAAALAVGTAVACGHEAVSLVVVVVTKDPSGATSGSKVSGVPSGVGWHAVIAAIANALNADLAFRLVTNHGALQWNHV
jgi:hypothetical protein